MAELDDIKLFFSVAEKKAFLERYGYMIERIHIEKEVSLYQNVYTMIQSAQDVAVKDGQHYDIHELFLKILKSKLLEL
ncbi:hypothetical protein [Sphingobacterium psychroaquaticum]|uniref:Uncharacterized protein n=1 Tax=Sphingobacterium psychroaquaticum TaxID=561061 RepID=A0A1X7K4Z9_9SPHI|nr:hypothetical protein [Sphingobacterium psychroaquaticum]SMG35776.1 hypothetical protein SAMN05660862_2546 [Sphingobacterium psychroaquaticum]